MTIRVDIFFISALSSLVRISYFRESETQVLDLLVGGGAIEFSKYHV